MARARNIKPGFFSNEDIAELSFGSRLLFIGLWTLSDREGRLEDRPKRIRGELFRFDDVSTETLSEWLDVLANKGFIVRYCVGKENYIQITNFVKHQNPHKKEQASSIPGPSEIMASPVITGQDREKPDHAGLIPSSLIPDSLIPDSLIQETSPPESAAEKVQDPIPPELPRSDKFDEFWKLYPRKKGNKPAKAAWRSKARTVRAADEIISGLKAHLPSLLAKEIEYVPYAQKWLNQERWKDAVEEPGYKPQQRNGWRSSPDIPNYPAAVLPGPDVGVSIAPMKIIRKGHAK